MWFYCHALHSAACFSLPMRSTHTGISKIFATPSISIVRPVEYQLFQYQLSNFPAPPLQIPFPNFQPLAASRIWLSAHVAVPVRYSRRPCSCGRQLAPSNCGIWTGRSNPRSHASNKALLRGELTRERNDLDTACTRL